MTTPTLHLEWAEESLTRWYNEAERFLSLSALYETKFTRDVSLEYKQLSLKCKTLGIVYHDRYKMGLDCTRHDKPLDDI